MISSGIFVRPGNPFIIYSQPINNVIHKPRGRQLFLLLFEDLVRVAGGLKRSAYTDSAVLARFDINGSRKGPGDRLEVNLAAVMSGDATTVFSSATGTF